MVIKCSCVALLLFYGYATIIAQREQPTREPSRQVLVDERKGFSPLYHSSDETRRRNGSYIIKLKKTTSFDDLDRIMAKLTDQNQNSSDEVAVQGLSGYSMVGQGVMAMLNKKALDTVSTTKQCHVV